MQYHENWTFLFCLSIVADCDGIFLLYGVSSRSEIKPCIKPLMVYRFLGHMMK